MTGKHGTATARGSDPEPISEYSDHTAAHLHSPERMIFTLNISRPPCGGFIVLSHDGQAEAAFGNYVELAAYVSDKMRDVLDIPARTGAMAQRFAPRQLPDETVEEPRRPRMFASIIGGGK